MRRRLGLMLFGSVLALPASAQDASRDRADWDAAVRSVAAAAPDRPAKPQDPEGQAGGTGSNDIAQASRGRPVRVILSSPYGR